jgi:hypothetical protein
MNDFEWGTLLFSVFTLIVTIAGWVITYLTQRDLLNRQEQNNKSLTLMDVRYTARREIATSRVEDLAKVRAWADEGYAIYHEYSELEMFNSSTEKFNISDTFHQKFDDFHSMWDEMSRVRNWANLENKHSTIVSVYDSRVRQSSKWDYDFDKPLPKDLPQILKAYAYAVYNYFWEQGTLFTNDTPNEYGYDPLADVIPNMGKHIPNLYKSIIIETEKLKEFVSTGEIQGLGDS